GLERGVGYNHPVDSLLEYREGQLDVSLRLHEGVDLPVLPPALADEVLQWDDLPVGAVHDDEPVIPGQRGLDRHLEVLRAPHLDPGEVAVALPVFVEALAAFEPLRLAAG